ncbi:hypothetical protein EON64_02240 [archaeon]|nr:MAG: hypothetical protein EON64_02240 [archaeon]
MEDETTSETSPSLPSSPCKPALRDWDMNDELVDYDYDCADNCDDNPPEVDMALANPSYPSVPLQCASDAPKLAAFSSFTYVESYGTSAGSLANVDRWVACMVGAP